MKPIKFKEHNVIYAEDQKEYLPLPVYKELTTKEAEVVSCWKLSFRERLKILFTGKLWWTVLTFNKPLQPQYGSVDKWSILSKQHFKNLKKVKKETSKAKKDGK